ncbi:MAG: lipoyl(octanoyl) transferase LipB [Chloroflexi bacterium]|nr:lipoyl(octanoyl) transferase LipB [Chloroflexota bacterium]
MANPCLVVDLGLVGYIAAWEMQRSLAERRWKGEVSDALLLVEHPHVFTIGRRGREADILAPRETLGRLGVQVHAVDRGGEVTYHGPGQLVGYPIINLHAWGGPIQYVRALEAVIMETLLGFGVMGQRIQGLTGVWVSGRKIAAIGVKVSRGVTTHGFALNVNTDLGFFRHIVPCGIRDRGVTSLAAELGLAAPMDAVKERLAHSFGMAFGFEMLRVQPQGLGVSVPSAVGPSDAGVSAAI